MKEENRMKADSKQCEKLKEAKMSPEETVPEGEFVKILANSP